MYKILLVDNDEKVLKKTKELLENEEHRVVAYSNSTDAIVEALKGDYDLVILDFVMEEIDASSFIDICRSARSSINILIYSRKDDVDSEIQMLDKDVSDFIPKGCDKRIFLKRIDRALKHANKTKNGIGTHMLQSERENLELDCINRITIHNNEIVQLTEIEFMILSLFLSMKNKTLSREYIHNVVWESRGGELEEYRTIDLYILKLRKKLGLKSILSVRSVGYVWMENKQ